MDSVIVASSPAIGKKARDGLGTGATDDAASSSYSSSSPAATRLPALFEASTAAPPRNVSDRISILHAKLDSNQLTVSELLELLNLCLARRVLKTAYQCVQHGLYVCTHSKVARGDVFAIIQAVMSYWRQDCFASRDNYRLNLSQERRNVIDDVCTILSSLYESMKSSALVATADGKTRPEIVALALAEALECRGDYGGALALLSVLMKAEDYAGLDPSYVIFKAAVLMQHIGKGSQASEYLEFIIDDVPIAHGYGKVHVLAIMYCLYSGQGHGHGGAQSSYMADKCEAQLQLMGSAADLSEALGIAKRPPPSNSTVSQTNDVSTTPISQLPTLSFRSHALFDALVLQALSRSDYVFAAELLRHEVRNEHPGKSSLLLTLAEVCVLLNERDQAIASAEVSYNIQPLNADTRNLLLSLAPGAWKDKLRSAPPIEAPVSANHASQQSRNTADSGSKDDEEESDVAAVSDRSLATGGSTDVLRARAIQREDETISDRDALATLAGGSWLLKVTPRVKGSQKSIRQNFATTNEGASTKVGNQSLKLPRIGESS